MQAAGNSFSFMKNTICDGLEMIARRDNTNVYDLINEQVANSSLGANGLIFLPYLLGERSPRWNPNASGAFIGLKMEHTKADIRTMNIIGGMAQGAPIRQILADIYGLKINKLNYLEEATSIGAAVAAGVGIGVLKDFSEINKFIKI